LRCSIARGERFVHIRILSATRRPYIRAGGIGLAFVVLSVAVTARVFVWPALQPLPERADAIIELAGPSDLDRDRVALELAREHRAPVLIQSTLPGDTACLPPVAGVRIECFYPDPNTTRGEARYIGAIATQRHWHSVILVTTPDQAWRASLRVSRCFAGTVYNATAPLRWNDWFRQIPYQWLASIKALTIQRTC
jgi:uncharacterized SAM-binding protein YcdF (DUF218 family)